MNAEETLTEYAKSYLLLLSEKGRTSRVVSQSYSKLRDLTIVEVYFMRNVRSIITDEEMAGFIIYIDPALPSIFESYRDYHGPFPNYLKRIMELRALSYMKDILKRRRARTTYVRSYMPYVESVAEKGADHDLSHKEDRLEHERRRHLAMDRIRYLCMKRPKRRRTLFVFLCTQMTNLSVSTIDSFCEALNCDKDQTFAIADFLNENSANLDRKRSRTSMQRKVDRHWSKMLELESMAYLFRNDEKVNGKLKYNKDKFLSGVRDLRNASRHVPYTLVAELLNLDRIKVASEVFWAKEVLGYALSDEIKPTDGPMGFLSEVPEETIRGSRISRFEPFKVFRIKLLHLNKAHLNSVRTCLDEARNHMKC